MINARLWTRYPQARIDSPLMLFLNARSDTRVGKQGRSPVCGVRSIAPAQIARTYLFAAKMKHNTDLASLRERPAPGEDCRPPQERHV